MEKVSENKKIKLFDRDVALALGVNEAIVISQIEYWLLKNKKRNVNYKNGRYWSFNSIHKWHKNVFYFWSESTVRRIFTSLEEKGILLVANFNKSGFDRTKWYSIDYKKLDEIVRENLMNFEIDRIENYCDFYGENTLNLENILDEKSILEDGIYETMIFGDSRKKASEKKYCQNESNTIQYEENIRQNESNICQNENTISQNDEKFCKMDNCNLSEWKNANFQNEHTNTKEYTQNNTKYIKQPLPSGIGVVKLKKQEELLKEFLGSAYTTDYAKRIDKLLKAKGKDYAYLQEKIELAKSKNLNSKCGYLYNAIKYDYREIASNFEKKEYNFAYTGYNNSYFENNRWGNKNKFKNFNETVYKYTPEELEAKIKEHNIRKYGEIA